jgi:hypothetical protein
MFHQGSRAFERAQLHDEHEIGDADSTVLVRYKSTESVPDAHTDDQCPEEHGSVCVS